MPKVESVNLTPPKKMMKCISFCKYSFLAFTLLACFVLVYFFLIKQHGMCWPTILIAELSKVLIRDVYPKPDFSDLEWIRLKFKHMLCSRQDLCFRVIPFYDSTNQSLLLHEDTISYKDHERIFDYKISSVELMSDACKSPEGDQCSAYINPEGTAFLASSCVYIYSHTHIYINTIYSMHACIYIYFINQLLFNLFSVCTQVLDCACTCPRMSRLCPSSSGYTGADLC